VVLGLVPTDLITTIMATANQASEQSGRSA
jgi:hypothetical protein